MSEADVVLEARGLAKRYGRRVWALAGIDLVIPSGGLTALVGPNGSGKSTLIRTCLGFEVPDAGSVLVCGIDPRRRRSEAVAAVGYVPQTPSLYRNLSIGEHLALAQTARPSFDVVYAALREGRPKPATSGRRALWRRAGAGGPRPGPRHQRTAAAAR